jgi:2,4-dienoyl-CoA reductase (NADPH2)
MLERGREVCEFEERPVLGIEMAHPRRWRVLHDLRAHGAVLLPGARVVEIGGQSVHCEIHGADGAREKREIPADTVVLATGLSGDTRLADALRAAGHSRVEVIGDAGGVGYLEGAIHSGFHAAIRI